MVFFHVTVFWLVFEFWFLQYITMANFVKYAFVYMTNLSLAGPYGIYEIIITMLIYAVVSDENATDEDYDLLFYYTAGAIVTGYL